MTPTNEHVTKKNFVIFKDVEFVDLIKKMLVCFFKQVEIVIGQFSKII